MLFTLAAFPVGGTSDCFQPRECSRGWWSRHFKSNNRWDDPALSALTPRSAIPVGRIPEVEQHVGHGSTDNRVTSIKDVVDRALSPMP